ncbi:hypothetical protein HAX54_009673 [Datura stramonium]|uniref:Uncharacterized protein n=1 Tax=Datura stramonium TaxID=4076 RepID=A0ABS8THR4_DATST|nr:hypothetical protein [Datura stramonium]
MGFEDLMTMDRGEMDKTKSVKEEGMNGLETNGNSSFDPQENGIPNEEDSHVAGELKSLRQERRINQQRKKSTVAKDIPYEEVGIDEGFKDIEKNKKAKFVGKLGGHEEYLDS